VRVENGENGMDPYALSHSITLEDTSIDGVFGIAKGTSVFMKLVPRAVPRHLHGC